MRHLLALRHRARLALLDHTSPALHRLHALVVQQHALLASISVDHALPLRHQLATLVLRAPMRHLLVHKLLVQHALQVVPLVSISAGHAHPPPHRSAMDVVLAHMLRLLGHKQHALHVQLGHISPALHRLRALPAQQRALLASISVDHALPLPHQLV